MATQDSNSIHPCHINAKPQLGNFTGDAMSHVAKARALSTLIAGEGFAAFSCMNDELQQHLLWLLSSELDQAIKAQWHEDEELRNKVEVQP